MESSTHVNTCLVLACIICHLLELNRAKSWRLCSLCEKAIEYPKCHSFPHLSIQRLLIQVVNDLLHYQDTLAEKNTVQGKERRPTVPKIFVVFAMKGS
jgi:hypothetical protein